MSRPTSGFMVVTKRHVHQKNWFVKRNEASNWIFCIQNVAKEALASYVHSLSPWVSRCLYEKEWILFQRIWWVELLGIPNYAWAVRTDHIVRLLTILITLWTSFLLWEDFPTRCWHFTNPCAWKFRNHLRIKVQNGRLPPSVLRWICLVWVMELFAWYQVTQFGFLMDRTCFNFRSFGSYVWAGSCYVYAFIYWRKKFQPAHNCYENCWSF